MVMNEYGAYIGLDVHKDAIAAGRARSQVWASLFADTRYPKNAKSSVLLNGNRRAPAVCSMPR